MIFQNFYWNTIFILFISYLIGSFPTAYIAGKIKGIDVSKKGSKNIGGMNTFTSVGRLAGVMVIFIDAGKGILVAYLADKFSDHIFVPMLAVVFALIGHNWMVYIGFRGGKGIAAFIGSLLYLSPVSFPFLYLLFVPIALFTLKDSYLSTAFAFFIFSFFLWIYEGSFWWLIFGLLVTILYSIKSYSLLKTYYTQHRRDINPVVRRVFKPFFRGI
ncbi:MAG: glycerol-3-phosphate acyltransferase [Actinomycetota bacterium]|nr:glycerol-3-phosphate acyltransferase [Actinomycetota bacterium]